MSGEMNVEIIDPRDQEQTPSLVGSEVVFLHRLAKQNPRSIKEFLQQAESMACADVATAESMIYTLKRRNADGQMTLIPGPSVRLAEVLMSAYKNMVTYPVQPVITDTTVSVRAVAMDLERLVLIGGEATRRITRRDGSRYGEDMITVTTMAAQSVAIRNAIFRLIPRTYVNRVYEEARKVAVGDQRTLAERRQNLMKWIDTLGVEKERVYYRLGVKGTEDITLEHLELMLGVKNSIQDNELSPDEAFPPIPEGEETTPDAAAPKLPPTSKQRGRPRKEKEAAPAAAPKPPPPAAKEQTSETIQTVIVDAYEENDKFYLVTKSNQTMQVEPGEVFEAAEKARKQVAAVFIDYRTGGRHPYVTAVRLISGKAA